MFEQEMLVNEVVAWEAHRNERKTTVNWQFTTADVRIKLKKNSRHHLTLDGVLGRLRLGISDSIFDKL